MSSRASGRMLRRWGLPALVVTGVGVRLLAGWARGADLVMHGNGMSYIRELAQRIGAGHGYTTPNGIEHVFQQPAYPAYLALAFLVAGASTWPVVSAANALLGGALTWATHRLGGAAFGPRVAWFAAAVAALHPYLVWHGQSMSDTALFTLLMVGWLGAVLAFDPDRPWRGALEAGLWLGAALWTRPSLIPLVPIGALSIWWRVRALRPALRHLVVSAMLAFVLTLPWLLRNHALTGRFPMMGTHGSSALWAANTEGAYEAIVEDRSFDAVSRAPRYAGTDLDVREFKTRFEPREAARRRDVFAKELRRIAADDPGRFATLWAMRLWRLWDVRFHPAQRHGRPVSGVSARQVVHAASFGPLLLLGILGALLAVRDRRTRVTAVTLLATLAAYSVTHALGAYYSRVRLPLDPVVGVLGALAVERAGARLGWWREREPAEGGTG